MAACHDAQNVVYPVGLEPMLFDQWVLELMRLPCTIRASVKCEGSMNRDYQHVPGEKFPTAVVRPGTGLRGMGAQNRLLADSRGYRSATYSLVRAIALRPGSPYPMITMSPQAVAPSDTEKKTIIALSAASCHCFPRCMIFTYRVRDSCVSIVNQKGWRTNGCHRTLRANAWVTRRLPTAGTLGFAGLAVCSREIMETRSDGNSVGELCLVVTTSRRRQTKDTNKKDCVTCR
ncbi:hypothetical protein BDV32DRAFT_106642 [Aspergillus pseudonomiae]|nr:hypothetical protein BDV32DRAFT_106642 [Aspergillus pseudonomiae]